MNILQMPRMIFSFSDGWDDLIRIHPSIARLFALLVLPLSLLPPAMIYYAGGRYGDVFVQGITPAQWQAAAGIFFLAELLTVPIMAWLIHLVARVNNAETNYHACFSVAIFTDAVRSQSVFRRYRWRVRLVGFGWTDLSRRLCVIRHARRYQGAANGNSDCQRWTVHVVDPDADCFNPLTQPAP